MTPPVRRLATFSLGAFVVVVVVGTVRAAPTPLKGFIAAVPEAEKAMASFHSHFDALCWLGAAALAAALHLLDDAGRLAGGWAWRLAAPYMAGSLLFSTGFAVKALGLAAGIPAIGKGLATALISGGGLCLLVAAGAALVILWQARRAGGAGGPGRG